jgi:hypothetical protein
MSFDMDTKIEVYPGQTVNIPGKLLNTGWLWLYDVTLKTENLTYDHTITPSRITVLPIKYYWVGVRGYRIPEKFNLTIKIPENETMGYKEFYLVANGSFRVYLPSEMDYKYYPIQVKQRIVLKVAPVPTIAISDLTYPDFIIQNEPFKISMLVINTGEVGTQANISINIPSDWEVDSKTKSVVLQPHENKSLSFEIVPTNTSGQITLYLTYPTLKKIINITKTGPFLIPQEEKVEKEVPGIVGRITGAVKTLPPILLLIIIILLGVIVWNLRYVVKYYKKRKKPES